MECSILSEVDDTSFSGRGSPRRYGRPLNWLPASNLSPAQRAGAQRLCAMDLASILLEPNIGLFCTYAKIAILPFAHGWVGIPDLWRPNNVCSSAGARRFGKEEDVPRDLFLLLSRNSADEA